MDPAPQRRGRPPSAAAEQSILDAAIALVREQGPSAVTVEAVAARAGVARTTVYRRYRNRAEVLDAAVRHLVEQPPPPPDLEVTHKLRWVLERVAAVVGEGLGAGGVAAVLTSADPGFTTVFRAALASQLSPLADDVTRDVDAGRLRAGVDGEVLVDLMLGAVLAELLRHGTLRPDWLVRTHELLLGAVT